MRESLISANRKLLFVVLLALLLLVPAEIIAGQTSRERAYADNLSRWNVPVFNLGTGMAYTADVRGVHGGLTNPAALGRIREHQFTTEYQRWGEGWDLYNMGVAAPMAGAHAYALQFSWLDYGELEPEDDELYRPQGNELLGNITYSRLLTNRLAVGTSIGVMSSKMGFQDRKTEPKVDLGLLWRATPDFWLGMTGKNLNSSLKFDDKENKVPPEYRGGAALYLYEDRIGLTGDVVYIGTEERDSFKTDDIGMAGGLRLMITESFRLSFGYHALYGKNEDTGFTTGMQLRYPNFRWSFGLVDSGGENITRGGATIRF